MEFKDPIQELYNKLREPVTKMLLSFRCVEEMAVDIYNQSFAFYLRKIEREPVAEPEYYIMRIARKLYANKMGKRGNVEMGKWGNGEIEEDVRRYGGKRMDPEVERMVEELDRKFEARKGGIGNSMVIRVAALAAVMVTAVVLWAIFKKENPQKLYAEYYEKYKFEMIRSEGENEPLYLEAVQSYNKGDYDESMRLSQEILEEDPGHTEARFVLGLSLQETGGIDPAIRVYKKLVEDSKGINKRIYYLSAWYGGLCYLWRGDMEEALEYFEIAGEGEGMYVDVEGIEELIEKME